MAFGKAFGAALVLYIGLNFGLSLVSMALAMPDQIMSAFTLENILYFLFAPAVMNPASGFMLLSTLTIQGVNVLNVLFSAIGLILPPLLAALVAGKLAEDAKPAFGAWLLVPIICAVIMVVLSFVLTSLSTVMNMLTMLLGGSGQTFMIVAFLLMGFANGLMWSGIACVVAGP